MTTEPVATPSPQLPKRPTPRSGPAPGRIVAAAASISAGIGLTALMAGAQPDLVVEVNPTPIVVEPASIVVELPAGAADDDGSGVRTRVVEAAAVVERPAEVAEPIARSEGS